MQRFLSIMCSHYDRQPQRIPGRAWIHFGFGDYLFKASMVIIPSHEKWYVSL